MVRETSRSRAKAGSIWETPRIKKMLAEPAGTPMDLTREEALAIVRDSAGSMPYLPDGREYVRKVRGIWGGLRGNVNG
jgi:hypothetical protein